MHPELGYSRPSRFHRKSRHFSKADPSNWRTLQVIIDNMMNLELLYVAANITGNQHYRHIANTHAITTMNNHIRPDGKIDSSSVPSGGL